MDEVECSTVPIWQKWFSRILINHAPFGERNKGENMKIVTEEEQKDNEYDKKRENYLLRMAVANANLNKMKDWEMREFIVSHLVYEYMEDPEMLKQDQELFLKEEV